MVSALFAASCVAAALMPALQNQGTWEQGAPPYLYVVARIGPWLLAAIALVLVARALARNHRYRAVVVLGAEDQAAVHAALVDVERRTHGEIVPVVLERSDAHPGAPWLAALCTLLLGSALLEAHMPWYAPHWLLLAQLALGAIGYCAAELLPDLKRAFVAESRASEMAEEQALQEFHRLGLHATSEATGVLLFVSLFERRVVVLGDRGIHAKVGDEHWQRTKDVILAAIARGSLRDGLIDGIRACGSVLEQHFPVREGDRNEIPDRVIVRRE